MHKKPVIAFVSSYPNAWWTGCEELWSHAALRLASEGFSVKVNSVRYNDLPDVFRSLIREHAAITFRKDHLSLLGRVMRRLLRIGKSYEETWMRSQKPELAVISEGDAYEGRRWMEACVSNNIPFVVITQGATPWMFPHDSEVGCLRKLYQKARFCYFVSEENREVVRSQLALALSHAKVVRNPFRVPYAATCSWPGEDKGYRFACIAAAEPQRKGQDLLLRILAQEEWRKRDITVDFISQGGCSLQALKDTARYLQLSSVRFSGKVSDIRNLWEQYHGLILPSRREGIPLVLVEAMLCGRICIVTDVGGNAEIIKDGNTGFIASSASVAALARAMERAWEKRPLWEDIGKKAAVEIRRIIPADPVGVFSDELKVIYGR